MSTLNIISYSDEVTPSINVNLDPVPGRAIQKVKNGSSLKNSYTAQISDQFAYLIQQYSPRTTARSRRLAVICGCIIRSDVNATVPGCLISEYSLRRPDDFRDNGDSKSIA